MKVGLFIPCYIDQFYPNVGIATLQLLEKYGAEVVYPLNQTCCGQPMANTGFENIGEKSIDLVVKNFHGMDFIVGPSGSCVLHLKEQLKHRSSELQNKVFELCEFLTDVVKIKAIHAEFPYKVGLHASCHGLRGLGLATPSELNIPRIDKPRSLLEKVKRIQLVELSRKDECCGFGGTFAVNEEAVSVRMGNDRIEDHLKNGVEVITATDMSCLMHLEGLIVRQKKNLKVMHIAEILNGNGIQKTDIPKKEYRK